MLSVKGADSFLAWGNAPGFGKEKTSALKARFTGILFSIPNVSLVEIDFITFEKLTILIFKRNAAMMLLLVSDVAFQFGHIRLPD